MYVCDNTREKWQKAMANAGRFILSNMLSLLEGECGRVTNYYLVDRFWSKYVLLYEMRMVLWLDSLIVLWGVPTYIIQRKSMNYPVSRK